MHIITNNIQVHLQIKMYYYGAMDASNGDGGGRYQSNNNIKIFVREHRGMKRCTVKVDMKKNSYGQNRSLWLTCLRGHYQDVDFSEDNYNEYKTSMLLNLK